MPTDRTKKRFLDIVENIDAILEYVGERSKEKAIVADRMRRDAIERCLSRISEAASKLGPIAERNAPEPNWQRIRSLGNVIRHSYDGLDLSQLWSIVTEQLRPLRAICLAASESFPNDP